MSSFQNSNLEESFEKYVFVFVSFESPEMKEQTEWRDKVRLS
jgi:hypothetical protein